MGVEVLDRGRRLPARLTLGPGFAAQEPSSSHSNYYYESQAVWDVASRVTRTKKGKLDAEGGFSGPAYWAGLEDQYFTSLILPHDSQARVHWRHVDLIPIPVDGGEVQEAQEPETNPILAVSIPENGGQIFIGPKKYELLKGLGNDLGKAVWFSSQDWLRVIVKYLFVCLVWIHDNVSRNWGMAIVLATLVLRIVLFPVNQYSMVRMKRAQMQMQKLAAQGQRDQEQVQEEQGRPVAGQDEPGNDGAVPQGGRESDGRRGGLSSAAGPVPNPDRFL